MEASRELTKEKESKTSFTTELHIYSQMKLNRKRLPDLTLWKSSRETPLLPRVVLSNLLSAFPLDDSRQAANWLPATSRPINNSTNSLTHSLVDPLWLHADA